jgi:TRAP-type mannitol/chloroaromatic compound transport system permease small subunit
MITSENKFIDLLYRVVTLAILFLLLPFVLAIIYFNPESVTDDEAEDYD